MLFALLQKCKPGLFRKNGHASDGCSKSAEPPQALQIYTQIISSFVANCQCAIVTRFVRNHCIFYANYSAASRLFSEVSRRSGNLLKLRVFLIDLSEKIVCALQTGACSRQSTGIFSAGEPEPRRNIYSYGTGKTSYFIFLSFDFQKSFVQTDEKSGQPKLPAVWIAQEITMVQVFTVKQQNTDRQRPPCGRHLSPVPLVPSVFFVPSGSR